MQKLGNLYAMYKNGKMLFLGFWIPSSVTFIGDSSFAGCSSLVQITIPSFVTSINDYAFARCSSLAQINIHSSVTSIGDSAFY